MYALEDSLGVSSGRVKETSHASKTYVNIGPIQPNPLCGQNYFELVSILKSKFEFSRFYCIV